MAFGWGAQRVIAKCKDDADEKCISHQEILLSFTIRIFVLICIDKYPPESGGYLGFGVSGQ